MAAPAAQQVGLAGWAVGLLLDLRVAGPVGQPLADRLVGARLLCWLLPAGGPVRRVPVLPVRLPAGRVQFRAIHDVPPADHGPQSGAVPGLSGEGGRARPRPSYR